MKSLPLLFSFISASFAHNIILFTANLKSHVMYTGYMGKALAANGHNVTAVAGEDMPIMPEVNSGDIKWLRYKMRGKPFLEVPENVPSSDNFIMASWNGIKTMARIDSTMDREFQQVFNDSDFMQQVYESKFDFAIIDPTIKSPFIVPYILGIPYANLAIDFDFRGMRVPVFSSYVPEMMTAYTERMTFFQRLVNLVASCTQEVIQLLGEDEGIQDTAKYAPERPPVSYYTLEHQASLFFTLRAPGFHFVRGSLPNMLDVGGIAARTPNLSDIPSDLCDIIDNAMTGFIMVSFGSWLSQPEETLQKFIQAFNKTHLTVIWKLKHAPAELPPNVKTAPWLPQNDLLGHPNIRGFITHCGGTSSLETVYRGVPVIAAPLGIDQHANAALFKERRLGVVIDINNFEVEELVSAINEITKPGSEFAARMSHVSSVCRSMPDAGMTASFWINHVIQHGDRHLRAAAYDLAKYQYFNIDVLAFIFLVNLLVCCVVIWSCQCICRRLCKYKAKQD